MVFLGGVGTQATYEYECYLCRKPATSRNGQSIPLLEKTEYAHRKCWNKIKDGYELVKVERGTQKIGAYEVPVTDYIYSKKKVN